jgi:tetratricopeptide (TPR) repeat protein
MYARPHRHHALSGAVGVCCILMLSLNACFLFGGGDKNESAEGGKGEAKQELTKTFVTSFEVGQTLKNAGRYQEALLVYYEVFAQDSLGVGAPKALNEIGDIYIHMQQYDKALETYDRLMTAFPTFEGIDQVKKKIEFTRAAQDVLQERVRVAKEGPSTAP